jgi:hypothetical protein
LVATMSLVRMVIAFGNSASSWCGEVRMYSGMRPR